MVQVLRTALTLWALVAASARTLGANKSRSRELSGSQAAEKRPIIQTTPDERVHPYPCDLSKQTYETVVLPSQSLSVAHGGRQEPPKEPIAGGRRRARDINVRLHDFGMNAPPSHMADAIKAESDAEELTELIDSSSDIALLYESKGRIFSLPWQLGMEKSGDN